MPAVYLAIAIVAEVAGTLALKEAEGFTRLLPSLVVVVGYGIAFYFLSLVVRVLPVGLVYAVWSGAGIILISLLGFLLYKEALSLAQVFGMGLIITGIVLLRLF